MAQNNTNSGMIKNAAPHGGQETGPAIHSGLERQRERSPYGDFCHRD